MASIATSSVRALRAPLTYVFTLAASTIGVLIFAAVLGVNFCCVSFLVLDVDVIAVAAVAIVSVDMSSRSHRA